MAPLFSIRRFRAVIACIFVASILTVIVCDVVCGFGRTLLYTNQGTFTSVAHPKEIAKNGHHEHGESHDHDHSHHHNGEAEDPQELTNHSHSTSSSEEDDCCEDMTNQLFKSLFNDQQSFVIKAPAQVFILLDVLSSQSDLTPIDYVNTLRVPPKISFSPQGNRLRILLSSFLI
jgi:hypothetical protein